MQTVDKNRRALGTRKEEMAAEYLRQRGYRICERNFRSRFGEIDIIAEDEGVLVFVEVKYRADLSRGYPAEAVGYAKQRRICKTADYYRVRHRIPEDRPCRFDVVAILGEEITLYQNAFLYIF